MKEDCSTKYEPGAYGGTATLEQNYIYDPLQIGDPVKVPNIDTSLDEIKCSDLGANCYKYQGKQTFTKSSAATGNRPKKCERWDDKSVNTKHRAEDFAKVAPAGMNLANNYCRNPDSGNTNKVTGGADMNTIWCYYWAGWTY